MNFDGNPSLDLELDYHNSSSFEKDGKLITRYVLSVPVSEEKEAELANFDNIKLVRDGCKHRYAPEIKYDVLYISEPIDEVDESSQVSDYLEAEEDLDETDLMLKLDQEVNNPDEGKIRELSKYASISSAMSELTDLVVLYKSLSQTFPEDQSLFESLISDSEVQLGKLSSLISNPETSDNMARGLAEGEAIIEETENYNN